MITLIFLYSLNYTSFRDDKSQQSSEPKTSASNSYSQIALMTTLQVRLVALQVVRGDRAHQRMILSDHQTEKDSPRMCTPHLERLQ